MAIAREIKAGWEHRFPELSGKWTHWRIKGDGKILADVRGDDLIGALKVVESNFGHFRSIKAVRAANHEGICTQEEWMDHEISRYENDGECPDLTSNTSLERTRGR